MEQGIRIRKLLLECAAVLVAGGVLSLAANAISPRGLALARNYFPKSHDFVTSRAGDVSGLEARTPPANATAQRIAALGFGLVDKNAVIQAFQNPERLGQAIIFIDARDDAHFQKGHIPGAFQLDYYRPENHLGVVLPAAQVARQIIVYCNGGECEDSELTAKLLRDAGVPPERIFVYAGGFAEWSAAKLPVELGARDSQNFGPAQP